MKRTLKFWVAVSVVCAGCGDSTFDGESEMPLASEPDFHGVEDPPEPVTKSTPGTMGALYDSLTSCTAAGADGLNQQLVDSQLCEFGNHFDSVTNSNIIFGPRGYNLFSPESAAALNQAGNQQQIYIISAFRSVAWQYLLTRGFCGAAAAPGTSNHQSGLAIDVDNYAAVRATLENVGFVWPNIANDPAHFDGPGTDRRIESVIAFQKLWNRNNPGDTIAEDGVWGPATLARMRLSPTSGFDNDLCGPPFGGFQVLGGEWNGAGGDSLGFVYGTGIFLRNARTDWGSHSTWDFTRPAFDTDRYVAGDWNGNGTDTIGILRFQGTPTPWGYLATFYFKAGNNASSSTYRQFDLLILPEDIPLAGDWNGDGIDTWGTYRPSTRTFYLGNSFGFTVDHTFVYGPAGAVPVAGDWDNNGSDSVGVFNPANRKAFLKNALNGGSADYSYTYGTAGDIPFAGRWGTAKPDTIGLFRPSNKKAYLRSSNTSGATTNSFKACSVSTNAHGTTPVALLMLLLMMGLVRFQSRRHASAPSNSRATSPTKLRSSIRSGGLGCGDPLHGASAWLPTSGRAMSSDR